MRLTLLLTGVTLALISMGCGGDSSDDGGKNGGGTVNSGLPADAQLQSLTPTQLQQLNDSLAGATASMQAGTCKIAAVMAAALLGGDTDAAVQQTCTQSYDQCVAAEPEPTTQTGEVSPDALAGCTATVGEFEACHNASITQFNAVAAQLPACNTLTLASLQNGTGGTPSTTGEPSECAAVNQKCPNLASAGEFTCQNGDSIPAGWQCDGMDDCGDNSDEVGCV